MSRAAIIHYTPYHQIGSRRIRNLALTECRVTTHEENHTLIPGDVTCKNCQRTYRWKQDNKQHQGSGK